MGKRRYNKNRRYKSHSKRSNFNKKRHKFKKRSPVGSLFYKLNRFVKKYPILSAAFSIIISIILFRFAWVGDLNKWAEFRLWIFLASALFFIIGLLAIKVWFRNNVSDFNSQHNLKWKNK